ncbi:hypothetical protein GKE82_11325 [Conexibacter sp. W3-3-2]|uniref:hypothetical protein n=1 Tax=Conexibacter sp. W3-3-2 TaxID=2675227 RepID=UPI0012B9F4B8|nr:hypothetical protein [Conexibacter sp. W3-3-2]MTD44865.1 hypothetical protein [Conexibacter sp. W3-3-2]
MFDMTSRTTDAPLGRLVLLLSAYAPVLIVAGIRGLDAYAAFIAIGIGIGMLVAWAVVLACLPRGQQRDVQVDEIEPIDAEVTGYIVSILLPAVAAGTPTTQDWVAYSLCAVLILVVAYFAKLWSVNPLVYLAGMRAVRVTISGTQHVALARDLPQQGHTAVIRRLAGVLFIAPDPHARS